MKKFSFIILLLIFSLFISGCGLLDKIICNHEFETEIVEVSCTSDGYKLNICKLCGHEEKSETVLKLGHNFGEWVVVKEASEVSDGLKQRTCSRCSYVENDVTASMSYADLSFIKEEFNPTTSYEIDDFESLFVKFQTAIIHRASTLKCKLKFAVTDLNDLLQKLVDKCDSTFSVNVAAKKSGNDLNITFTYPAEPSKKFNAQYEQLLSINYVEPSSDRAVDFDDFKINQSANTFKVKTTDQLYYALERGVKPICESGSKAEQAYSELKKVLRKIVDDDMSDLQKALAIYDYIVMNVTYDQEVYNKLSINDFDFASYKSFYLEGVLFDKLAVCEGISKSFTSFCNIEGIPCVTVVGYQTANKNGANHAWNKIYLNGKWYIIDPTSGGTIVGDSEVLSYKYCLISEAEYKAKYTGETYTNLKCLNSINVFECLKYRYLDVEKDFNISSQAELDHLVAYFNSVQQHHISMEFRIDFDCGASALDEVKKAFSNNHLSTSISYSEDGDMFKLYK